MRARQYKWFVESTVETLWGHYFTETVTPVSSFPFHNCFEELDAACAHYYRCSCRDKTVERAANFQEIIVGDLPRGSILLRATKSGLKDQFVFLGPQSQPCTPLDTRSIFGAKSIRLCQPAPRSVRGPRRRNLCWYLAALFALPFDLLFYNIHSEQSPP